MNVTERLAANLVATLVIVIGVGWLNFELVGVVLACIVALMWVWILLAVDSFING
jgi:hypothetical protein